MDSESTKKLAILSEELEKKGLLERYKKALIEARGDVPIMKDIDKNFAFIFNGSEAVIRLDDIKFLKETKNTEIYTYKNYKGKTTELEVIKAYPGLREEVFNIRHIEHEIPFPKNFKEAEKLSQNPIIILIIIGIPVLIGLISYLFF